jgi:hypothetical protein
MDSYTDETPTKKGLDLPLHPRGRIRHYRIFDGNPQLRPTVELPPEANHPAKRQNKGGPPLNIERGAA